jgi:hypothetical protein
MDSPAGLPAGRARHRLCAAVSLSLFMLWLPAHAHAAAPDSWSFARSGSPIAGLGSFVSRGANYAGRTAQDAPVVVEVAGTKVKSVNVFWYARCSSGKGFDFGGPITGAKSTLARIGRGGRFKGRGLGSVDLGDFSAALSERVQGKLSANAALGSFSVHVDIVDHQTGTRADSCDTGNVLWKAPAPQTLFYGGSSTQGQPVVVQLRADRRQVKAFRIAWYASCTSQSSVDYADALTEFALTPGGSFGDSFTQTYPDGSGGSVDYAYVLSGKVGRKNASGRFQVVVTMKDANGAVADTCTSPSVRWNARQ